MCYYIFVKIGVLQFICCAILLKKFAFCVIIVYTVKHCNTKAIFYNKRSKYG